ncbi:MAG: sensor histidine kinase [Planctomycetes bacterium]|nr:sensor histidine kinase [Planctomycetota bacterium]
MTFPVRVYQDDVERELVSPRGGVLDFSQVEFIDLNALGILLEHLWAGGRWVEPTHPRPRAWLGRIGFWEALGGSAPSEKHEDVLLEFTRVSREEDVGEILGRVTTEAAEKLRRYLNYAKGDVRNFCVALSELCGNIPEHAGAHGWAAIQKYRHRGRNIVKIAVVDGGCGVRASLAPRLACRTDLEALDAAFFRNLSRFAEAGRGNGLREVRKLAEKWGAKLTLRSGEAKVAVVSEGMSGVPRATGLAFVPGTQVLMSFPQRP